MIILLGTFVFEDPIFLLVLKDFPSNYHRTNRFDAPLKVALFLGLPGLFGIWLGLSIAASVFVGVGYGFFTPWVSAFEAFRHDDDSKKFFHCVVDGTWGTIKGSCTVVRDFADLCYHSYPLYLQELRESPSSQTIEPLRLIHIPGCIIAGILGLIVEIPLYTAIAIVKSPYMLFKGWQRLIHDLISREGPFLETACIPIAGLTILLWPLVVIGSIIAAIFTSFFIGLYASIVVYQERSFRRGIAYVVAMVAEFDEYTNDWLYLREGSILPKPRYRKKKISNSSELATDQKATVTVKFSSVLTEAPSMIVPRLSSSRSVREAIQEVKMVQVWGHMMRACEVRGKQLLDADVITTADLYGWLKAKNGSENPIIDFGLPCYAFLQTIIHSINAGSDGLVLLDGLEVTHLNRPQDRLFDWFFHPILVLKEQIRVIQLEDFELKFLEKRVLFGNDTARLKAWDNGGLMPEDTLKAAQIEGISRRLIGMNRSIAKFPTYRRRFKQVVKTLIIYSIAREDSANSSASYSANMKHFKSASVRVVASRDMV
ncbi:OLC1v1010137C1 [Oldenlandia corymbosa var. corymbosa]|uniref:OLC1v1010137C1 n=1 Tax=Oldenlandia corymbosa var. corymbosa TaxID=529605 RepID=A0AAV1DTX9_OLDCO|nr:OLC1v1010137C1 [Oldenlandia corymbosa var. corymbosa]